MSKKLQVRVKIVPLGVDILDHDGTMLAGITERDAIDLHRSLTKLLPRIKRLAKQS